MKQIITTFWETGFHAFPLAVSFDSKNGRKKIDWLPSWGDDLSLSLSLDWVTFLGNKCNGIGVKTGIQSGLTVIDGDTKNGYDGVSSLSKLFSENTPSVKTPTGRHWWCTYSNELKTSSDTRQGMDIRNDGAFVICPPSSIPGYGRYQWDVPLSFPLQNVPQHIIEQAKTASAGCGLYPSGYKKIGDLTALQHRILKERIARSAAAPIGFRSHADFAVCCWALKTGLAADELFKQVRNIGKFATAGFRYFELTFQNAQKLVR